MYKNSFTVSVSSQPFFPYRANFFKIRFVLQEEIIVKEKVVKEKTEKSKNHLRSKSWSTNFFFETILINNLATCFEYLFRIFSLSRLNN